MKPELQSLIENIHVAVAALNKSTPLAQAELDLIQQLKATENALINYIVEW